MIIIAITRQGVSNISTPGVILLGKVSASLHLRPLTFEVACSRYILKVFQESLYNEQHGDYLLG